MTFCNKKYRHRNEHEFNCCHKDIDIINNKIDIAFVIQTTVSMDPYKNLIIKEIKEIINKFKIEQNSKIDFKYSFTLYRDHEEQGTFWGENYLTKAKDFTNYEEIIKFINEGNF